MLSVTSIYAALLALVFVVMSTRVIRYRKSERISLGDGGDAEISRRIRAHGNFAEYVPLALILLGLAEMQGAPAWALHLLGSLLLIGRVLHGYALSVVPQPMRLRVVGMALTFAMLVVTALGLLGHALI
ncbi:MAPEG family protein [Mesobacterium sp. TK19101]|uniref:MAPEG family protein n=1 Tax=Mesobacterium hydrothermale TaxID=3111907 RepID=A0ABU6HFP6_9RHOB|nr:MAPEG family protein [Mesobacterium sp. TK19101]MEC3859925.1 MAPEG family protein [Mesobacterium sp. TK19101]